MNAQQQKALITQIMGAIKDAVDEAGPMGAPGGHLYAAVMSFMTLEQFETIMGVLVKAKLVEKRGQCYFPVTPKVPLAKEVDEDRLGFGLDRD